MTVWCAAEGRAREVTQTLWGVLKMVSASQTLDTRLFTQLEFVQIVTVPWFFPLEGRKYLIYFLFYRLPQL